MYTNFKTYVLSTVGDAPLCPENWCVARLLSTDRPKRGRKQLWGTHMLEVSLPVEILQQPNFQLQTWMGGTWKANQRAVRRGILVHRRCGGGGNDVGRARVAVFPFVSPLRAPLQLSSLALLVNACSASLPQSGGPLSTLSSVSCASLSVSQSLPRHASGSGLPPP